MYDAAIIGAGICGTMIARELSRYRIETVVLEKCNDIAKGTTRDNHGVVLSGYDCPEDSLMGRYAVTGNSLFPAICDELSIPYKRVGSLILAYNPEEIRTLKSIMRLGKRRGIMGLRLLKGNKIQLQEPSADPSAIAALYDPSTGLTNPKSLAIACMENAVENGVDLMLNYEVQSIKKTDHCFYISSKNKFVRTKAIINCAGILSDDVAAMIIAFPDFRITPGSREIREEKTQQQRLQRIILNMNQYDPLISENPQYPDSDRNDFVLGESEVDGFFNVAGISLSGLSASPAIAGYIGKVVLDYLGTHLENPYFNPFRQHYMDPVRVKEIIKVLDDTL